MSRVRTSRPATMADLETLPPHVKGEIIDGVLYTQPRPRATHQMIGSLLGGDLLSPYQRGRGGPGGWWILDEPGITVPGSPEFSPDLAGWRRERMPRPPHDRTIDIVPDWLCEISSPSTRGYDLQVKRPFYARIGVAYHWWIDIDSRSLTVSQLVDGRWVELAVHGGDDTIRAEPFGEVELALAEWWQTLPPPVVE